MSVVVRFAPSPTGYLHIGGVRTGLFNYLFARHHKGKFLLRIEDTDKERSTKEAVDAILQGLDWLGLRADAEPVFQSKLDQRHKAVVQELLDKGEAYYCYCSPEELEQMREDARANKKPYRYNGMWRDRDPSEAPKDRKPVVRIKSPQSGEHHIADLVQGDVRIKSDELDDFILLRSDGSPTYMLSVVVDDHDMGITHIIRGDDHLTNAFRQGVIYKAMGWDVPQFAHIPLIHGPDGAKLSKRHGALGVEAYKDMGILPEALKNYLLKLGWGHGDDEIISETQAIEWFDTDGIGRSPARFDLTKMLNLNGHYIRQRPANELCELVQLLIEKELDITFTNDQLTLLEKAMPALQERAKDLNELAQNSLFYFRTRPLTVHEDAAPLIEKGKDLGPQILPVLEKVEMWTLESLEQALRAWAEESDIKFGKIAQFIRASLTGQKTSPGLFDVMYALGKEETLGRLGDVL